MDSDHAEERKLRRTLLLRPQWCACSLRHSLVSRPLCANALSLLGGQEILMARANPTWHQTELSNLLPRAAEPFYDILGAGIAPCTTTGRNCFTNATPSWFSMILNDGVFIKLCI